MIEILLIGFILPMVLLSFLLSRHTFFHYVLHGEISWAIMILCVSVLYVVQESFIIVISIDNLNYVYYGYTLAIASFFLSKRSYGLLNFALTPAVITACLMIDKKSVIGPLIAEIIGGLLILGCCYLLERMKINSFQKLIWAMFIGNVVPVIIFWPPYFSLVKLSIVVFFLLLGTFLIMLWTILYFRYRNEIAQRKKELDYENTHDQLTTLRNYRAFLRFINRSEKDDSIHTVLMFDIDNFKKINDHYGHLEGNKILKFFAQNLKQTFTEDFAKARLFRFGGEEFCVTIEAGAPGECYLAANKLKKLLKKTPFITENNIEVKLTFSSGIAQMDQFNDIHAAIREADAALYQAKNNGRDQIVISQNQQN